MPVGDGRADIVRRIEGVEGTVRMRHEWVVRFGYGKIRPWVSRHRINGTPVITAVAGPDKLILRGPRLPVPVDGRHADEFEVRAGDELTFATTWIPSHHEVPDLLAFDERIAHTVAVSEAWAGHCSYAGPYRDEVVRSLLTLRLMTHAGTGGIVAAPTTSLPEDFGGVRNWDYRYCWLRDASSPSRRCWPAATGWRPGCGATGCCGRWPATRDLQIMYAVDGARTCRSGSWAISRVRRLDAGAGRQRRGGPAADRRARRGDDGAGDGP